MPTPGVIARCGRWKQYSWPGIHKGATSRLGDRHHIRCGALPNLGTMAAPTAGNAVRSLGPPNSRYDCARSGDLSPRSNNQLSSPTIHATHWHIRNGVLWARRRGYLIVVPADTVGGCRRFLVIDWHRTCASFGSLVNSGTRGDLTDAKAAGESAVERLLKCRRRWSASPRALSLSR